MYGIKEIEDALVAEMNDDADLAGMCRTIAPFSGEQADLLAEIEKMTASFPAVFAAYGGSVFSESANRSFDDEMQFILFAAAKDLRGRSEAAQGVYEILERLKGLLINNNLDLNIEPLHPVSIDPVAVTGRLAVYGFVLKTSFSTD